MTVPRYDPEPGPGPDPHDSPEAPLRDPAGAVVGTPGTARDLTLERQCSRRLSYLPTVAALLSGMAHELSNPLNTILNFTQLMLMDPRSEDDREALETIQLEAGRAAQAVTDLRLIARQVVGTGAERVDVDFNDLVRDALRLRRYPSGPHTTEVSADLAPGSLMVRVDRVRLEQALLELLLHMERTASGCRLWLRTSATCGEVTLQVTDVEPGAPGETDEHDPDRALVPDPARDELDLRLVHAIVGENGGKARIASLGGGTMATLHFSPAGDSTPAEPALAQGADAWRSLAILVVDDEVAIRCSIQRYLERRGHRVDAAGDGEEALALLRERAPEASYDVILSDLRMPGLGGKQLLDRIRQGKYGSERRVVFMTGDATSSDAAWGFAATGTPLLMKPVDLLEVARIIEGTADRRPLD